MCSSRSGRNFALVISICWLTISLITGCDNSDPKSTGATGAAATPPNHSEVIAILFRDGEDPYARAIREGINVASEDFDLQLEWMSTGADDSSRQVELLRKALAEHLRAICIAPINASDVVAPLEAAAEAGIPVVALERPLPSKIALVSFVSTDHFHLGRIVAQHVAKEIERGKLLLLSGSADDAASTRRQGFQFALTSELKDLTAIEVDCQESTQTALSKALKQQDDVAAIVALDTQSAAAAVRLVADRQLTLRVFGYGAWNGIESDIQQQRLAATVLEDPYIIGYSSMMALSKHFSGGENLEFIMPEPTIVTARNLEQENVKRLLESNMVPVGP